jgi:hypothetical protein
MEIIDDILFEILVKLNVAQLYRVYLLSSKVRSLVDKEFYWRKRIESEGMLLPTIATNLRKWYLDIVEWPIPGQVFHNNKLFRIKDIVKMGLIHINEHGYAFYPDGMKVKISHRVKSIHRGDMYNPWYYLTDVGYLYTGIRNARSILVYPEKILKFCVFGNSFEYEKDILILDVHGRVLIGKDWVFKPVDLPFNETISNVLQTAIPGINEHGFIFTTNDSQNYLYNARTGKTSRVKLRPRIHMADDIVYLEDAGNYRRVISLVGQEIKSADLI